VCGSASCSRLRLSSTGPCPATPRVTWPTTVSSSPTLVSDNCVLPTLEHSLSVGTRSSFGDRTFAAAGPQVWNSLPPNLRLCGVSYSQFRQLLKTFHSDSEATAQCELFLFHRIEIFLLTYLLKSLCVTIRPSVCLSVPCQSSVRKWKTMFKLKETTYFRSNWQSNFEVKSQRLKSLGQKCANHFWRISSRKMYKFT